LCPGPELYFALSSRKLSVAGARPVLVAGGYPHAVLPNYYHPIMVYIIYAMAVVISDETILV
jgi:hypothetical protein